VQQPTSQLTASRRIFCDQCGRPLRGAAHFCSHCGATAAVRLEV
jgi:predicted amidophosphoribosyltransferase